MNISNTKRKSSSGSFCFKDGFVVGRQKQLPPVGMLTATFYRGRMGIYLANSAGEDNIKKGIWGQKWQ